MSDFQRIAPPDHLKDWVQFFWIFEGFFSEVNPYQQITAASVFPKLAFQYDLGLSFENDKEDDSHLIRSGFHGQTERHGKITGLGKVGVIGVSFFPPAPSILFGLSANELVNGKKEISEMLGSEGKRLEERILNAPDNLNRLQVLCVFLRQKLSQISSHKSVIQASIQHILDRKGEVKIDELISSYSISQRQFERKFKAMTGFSAKKFSRIVRFESGVFYFLQTPLSLTRLSYELGYADQSHFSKDFKAFTGLNPKKYFKSDLSIFQK